MPDFLKDLCVWIVGAELVSCVLCLIALPWWIVLKKTKEPQISVGPVSLPQIVQPRPKRHRCPCGKLLPANPESVEVDKNQTIGVWTCRKCQAPVKLPI